MDQVDPSHMYKLVRPSHKIHTHCIYIKTIIMYQLSREKSKNMK